MEASVSHLLRRLGQQLVVLLGHAAGVFEEVLRHLADGIGLPRKFVVQRRKRLYVLRLLFHHAAQALGLVGIAQLRLRQTVEHALVAIQNFLTLLANLAHRPRRVAEGRQRVGDVLNCLLLIAAGILQRDLQVVELAVHRVVHPADVRVGHVVHQLRLALAGQLHVLAHQIQELSHQLVPLILQKLMATYCSHQLLFLLRKLHTGRIHLC